MASPSPINDGISPDAASVHAPWRHDGDPQLPAVLLLHGFTGSPASMRPLAQTLTNLRATLSVPRLPGHGGTWQQLRRTGWDDWRHAAASEFEALAATHRGVIVVGLSMGGALALALGITHAPQTIIALNPALHVDSPLAPLLPVLWRLVPSVKAIGGDIEKPQAEEFANDRTPLRSTMTLHRGLAALREQLWMIDAPVILGLSGRDAVVSPRSYRTLRSKLSSRPRTVALRRSRHVATLDYDAHLIADEVGAAVVGSRGEV